MRTIVAWLLALAGGWTASASAGFAAGADEPPALLIQAARVVDGSGRAEYRADVRLRGGRIAAIGELAPIKGERVIDAAGLVLAPGFIDLHTHSDRSILDERTRLNRNYLTQGVTTIVTGNCGSGPTDVAKYLAGIRASGAGTNVAHLIPHGSLRERVMGDEDRAPTESELAEMRRLVDEGMAAGAWGMSTGLIYRPGRYAAEDELIELSKVVARFGGLYASHIRDEGTGLVDAVGEALRIGRESGARVHVSHLKAGGKAAWGLVEPACAAIELARRGGQVVTADQYPYVASATSLAAMVVPDRAQKGGAEGFKKLADDAVEGPKLRAEIAAALERRNGGASVRISRFAPRPDWAGKDLKAIGDLEGVEPVEVVVRIMSKGGAGAISFGMSEEDVRSVMRRDYVATASDGSAHEPGGEDRPHPRSYGTFPRKIWYALDEKVITLEEAVRSCSGLPAEIVGLPDRGIARVGAVADLVVFDPTTFRDLATFDDPTRLAEGVRWLLLGGRVAIEAGTIATKPRGSVLTPETDGPADLVIRVGRVWTGDASRPWAEAVACREGGVIFVGSRLESQGWMGPETEVIDLPTAFATPGLIDAHGHMSSLGSKVDEIDLRGVARLEDVAGLVRSRMAERPGDGWILGQSWDQSLWPGGAFPTAAALDAVAPGRPVWLKRVDGHAGWANSAAMRAAGIGRESRVPDDGQMIVDASGEPTGVFIDGAMGLVDRVVPAARDEDLERWRLAAQEEVLRLGLTGVHDAGLSAREIAAYRRLEESGRLKIRVYGMASPPAGREVEFVSKPPSPSSGDRFVARAIKLFADGAMGSRGALMDEPYADDPTNRGLALIDGETLRLITEAALRNDWQVCTHAIGDRGNALVLDAYLAARAAVPGAVDPRLRVEHAQVVRSADVDRFAEGRIIASMQPSHASTDQRWADARLGPERVLGAYAWRWFADAGVALAFGSDFPVEVADPLWGLHGALTRKDERGLPKGGWHAEHLLTLEETLRGFTRGAAYAGFEEDRLGTLRASEGAFRADLTIFDRDLFEVGAEGVRGAKVLMTIIDGEVVFRAE